MQTLVTRKKVRIGAYTVEIDFYSIRFLCQTLHKSPKTIKRWEKLGLLHKPMFNFGAENGKHPFRWYTADEIRIYLVNYAMYPTHRGSELKNFAFFTKSFAEIEELKKKLRTGEANLLEFIERQEIQDIKNLYQIGQTKRQKRNKENEKHREMDTKNFKDKSQEERIQEHKKRWKEKLWQ